MRGFTTGYWKLDHTMPSLNEEDMTHISEMIAQGFTEGQLLHIFEDDEENVDVSLLTDE